MSAGGWRWRASALTPLPSQPVGALARRSNAPRSALHLLFKPSSPPAGLAPRPQVEVVLDERQARELIPACRRLGATGIFT